METNSFCEPGFNNTTSEEGYMLSLNSRQTYLDNYYFLGVIQNTIRKKNVILEFKHSISIKIISNNNIRINVHVHHTIQFVKIHFGVIV